MTTVSIVTLGCKVNQYESEALISTLEQRGYLIIPFYEGADITIINTCTVTHRADFQSRQMIRRAFRINPNSIIIVTGCYSQVEPEAMVRIEGVKYILGNKEKMEIPELLPLMEKGELPPIQVTDIQREKTFRDTPTYSFHRHTRAFLKIQDGCNNRCSYCIVPYARGPSRSLLPETLIEHLKELKRKEFKEVVLTGIHIGTYGMDLDRPFSLEKMLKRIEEEETPDRIRLSSIEPLDFSKDLISFLSQSTKVCPHLHIPIQSGDNEILKMMNRNYECSFIVDLIQELHQRIPKLAIGADIIVGFPGETEEKFENTYRLIESLPFSYLHVFPFSKRKGTTAYHFPEKVNEAVVKRRVEELRKLGKQKRQSFYNQFLNQELKVLIEEKKEKNNRWRGLSRNYIPVFLSFEEGSEKKQKWVKQEWLVKVFGLTENGVVGEVIGE